MSLVCRFRVDWDATDWMVAPDYSQAIDNITDYVKTWRVGRGKDKELGNTPAGTLELTLKNSDKRFSPPYAAGPLFGKIRPWLPIQAEWYDADAVEYVSFYTGFISRIRVVPHLNVQEAYFYCTDGTDLLARNMVTQSLDDSSSGDDGKAVQEILAAAGWEGRQSIDHDGPTLKFPAAGEY